MREINIENCIFNKPEKFSTHHESFLSMNGEKGFIIQSPKLILRNSTDSYFEFLISRNKDRHRDFYNVISHLEDSAIVQISEHSDEWFGKKIPRNQIDLMFRSSLNHPFEINDPFVFRINKEPGLEAELNYPTICLIKVNGIMFGKNSSSLDMKVLQIKVIKTEKISSESDYTDEYIPLSEKPFYNDNASIVPHNLYTKEDVKEVKEFKEIGDNPVNNVDKEIIEEKVIETIADPILEDPIERPTVPVQEISNDSESVRGSVIESLPESAPVKKIDIEELEREFSKSILMNDFQRAKDLSMIIRNIKLQ